MENKITYNCYLHNGIDGVTRNREVECNASKSFAYLKDQLVAKFPVLRETNYSVLWQNKNNLWITILGNEGLKTALSEMGGVEAAGTPRYELHVHLVAADKTAEVESTSRSDEIEKPIAEGTLKFSHTRTNRQYIYIYKIKQVWYNKQLLPFENLDFF